MTKTSRETEPRPEGRATTSDVDGPGHRGSAPFRSRLRFAAGSDEHGIMTIEMTKVRTILFDLGGVIVPFDFKRAYSRMAPLLNYPVAEVATRLRSTDLIQRFETGGVAPERFVEEVCAVLEMKIAYEEFCDLWTSVF